MEIRHQLRDQLKRLKMPGLWQALDVRLSEATANNLGHLELLSLLVLHSITVVAFGTSNFTIPIRGSICLRAPRGSKTAMLPSSS